MSAKRRRKLLIRKVVIVVLILLISCVLLFQYAQMNTALRCVENKDFLNFTGRCVYYNETELITKTRAVKCSFQINDQNTIILHGGIFQTKQETLNLLRKCENTNFTFQYVCVQVLGIQEYWVVGIEHDNKTVIELDNSVKYFNNGAHLYLFLGVCALVLGFLISLGLFLPTIIRRMKSNTSQKRKRNKAMITKRYNRE